MNGRIVAQKVDLTTGRFAITSIPGPVLWILAILALPSLLSAVRASEPDRMPDIIQNARTSEQLYANLEVVATWSFHIDEQFNKGLAPSGLVVEAERSIRNVYQNGMCYLRTGGAQRSSNDRSVSLDFHLGYDGEKTRVVDQELVANVVDGPLEDANLIRPHTLLLGGARVYFPLSIYLEAGEALKSQPLARPYAKRIQLTVSYEGEEVVEGLNCFKVRCETQSRAASAKAGKAAKPSQTTPADVRFIWLAIERNYLPVRTEFYHTAMKVNRPVEVGRVDELREIAPGVWFPFRTTLEKYNWKGLVPHTELVRSSTEHYTVTRVDLDPHYDRRLFSEIAIPRNAAVYEVRNDRIIKSYREGDDRQLSPRRPRGWLRLLPVINIVVIVTLVGIFAVHRRRRR